MASRKKQRDNRYGSLIPNIYTRAKATTKRYCGNFGSNRGCKKGSPEWKKAYWNYKGSNSLALASSAIYSSTRKYVSVRENGPSRPPIIVREIRRQNQF